MADEPVQEPLVLVAEGPEQDEQRQPALAGHPGAGGDVLGGLGLDVELDPLPPVGVDGAGDDRLGVTAGLEDHARGPHQLADHDPLGAVDDEGALVRHHREVPHEDGLLLDLPGLRVHEPRPDEHRGGIGHVLLLALLLGELGRRAQVGVGRVVLELEAQLAGEVLDRADVGERFGQTLVQEPAERVPLDGDEVRQRRTSSRLANEKRSGLLDREGNGRLLPGGVAGSERDGGTVAGGVVPGRPGTGWAGGLHGTDRAGD